MALIDAFGRTLDYVRLSVTDRCSFRCLYCMPESGVRWIPHEQILSYEELLRLVRVLSGLGMKRIRITGGEPLVRRGIGQFLQDLRAEQPDLRIALTTNGALLEEFVPALSAVRLDALNVSLDTLDEERFARLTRTGRLAKVLQGIEAARSAGIAPLKLNTVLIRDFNDGEIPRLLDYADSLGGLLRLIEFMPLEDSIWSRERFISADEILARLPASGSWEPLPTSSGEGYGPARYYRERRSGRTLGIISAVSHHFCPACNRVRITATGNLRTCLFETTEYPLGPMLREKDEEALARAICEGIRNKPRDWMSVRDGHLQMSGIGG
jgi:cyclic pyranopterin phosphate synthase